LTRGRGRALGSCETGVGRRRPARLPAGGFDRMSEPEARISAFVIARDEEDGIVRCLRSISWADERLVVVDAATTDRTAEMARPLATDVIVRPWEGFVGAKRFAIAATRHPWVFWIDADEEATPALADAIRSRLHDPGPFAGFEVRRRNHYLGRTIRHGNWGHDRVLRLFRREKGSFPDREVHESMAVEGPVGRLDGYLEHWSYRDLGHHIRKIENLSRLWAVQAAARGARAGVLDLLLRPPIRFVKGYLLRAGFLDGKAGLVLALMDSLYVGMKYARLLEREDGKRKRIDTREEQ